MVTCGINRNGRPCAWPHLSWSWFAYLLRYLCEQICSPCENLIRLYWTLSTLNGIAYRCLSFPVDGVSTARWPSFSVSSSRRLACSVAWWLMCRGYCCLQVLFFGGCLFLWRFVTLFLFRIFVCLRVVFVPCFVVLISLLFDRSLFESHMPCRCLKVFKSFFSVLRPLKL